MPVADTNIVIGKAPVNSPLPFLTDKTKFHKGHLNT